MEFILTIFGGALLFTICFLACKKRSEVTHRCPKCGTICNASPWSTGLRHSGGGEVYKFKCPNCGEKFLD